MAGSPPPSGNVERGGDARIRGALDAWKLPPGPVSLSELEGLPHQIFTPFETSPLPWSSVSFSGDRAWCSQSHPTYA
jgi:hypothetical protein